MPDAGRQTTSEWGGERGGRGGGACVHYLFAETSLSPIYISMVAH